MSNEESVTRLSKAAEELVKAAYEQRGVDLEIDMNTNLEAVNRKLSTVNENLRDTKKAINSLMTAIKNLNSSIKEEGQKNRLTSAVQCAHTGNFNMYGPVIDGSTGKVEPYYEFITSILKNFLSGHEYNIDAYSFRNSPEYNLRGKLEYDVHALTGSVPRFAKNSDGHLCIFRK